MYQINFLGSCYYFLTNSMNKQPHICSSEDVYLFAVLLTGHQLIGFAHQAPAHTSHHFSEHLFWEEAARVVTKAQHEFKQEQFLTLALGGWTDNGRSLYAYTVTTTDCLYTTFVNKTYCSAARLLQARAFCMCEVHHRQLLGALGHVPPTRVPTV